jgi:hypothetical protein
MAALGNPKIADMVNRRNALQEKAKMVGLSINVSKTKSMTIRIANTQHAPWKVMPLNVSIVSRTSETKQQHMVELERT